MKRIVFQAMCAVGAMMLCATMHAQISSGSDGHDGPFNPTTSTNIDMADHPDGIYQYSSVNIRSSVTVTFTPNANNTPVIWLVQGNCVINGIVDVSGKSGDGLFGGIGGPGGYGGGSSASGNIDSGAGPGGGAGSAIGGNASYGSRGDSIKTPSGPIYGNSFILPLLGGSGGGAGSNADNGSAGGGGGGGGAILIAAPNQIDLNGVLFAAGGASGDAGVANSGGGAGSGGAVRIVTTTLAGSGQINAVGGRSNYRNSVNTLTGNGTAGAGRVRLDVLNDHIAIISGTLSQGFQPIIIPGIGPGTQLNIASVAGVNVGANPKGLLMNPDLVIPAQLNGSVAVVVQCSNLPLNTSIAIIVIPTIGSQVQGTGVNNSGTLAASTATINLNLPRGGGLIYAQAVTAVSGTSGASLNSGEKVKSYAQTGLTTSGDRFANIEVTAALGGAQKITYITASNKRYVMPEN